MHLLVAVPYLTVRTQCLRRICTILNLLTDALCSVWLHELLLPVVGQYLELADPLVRVGPTFLLLLIFLKEILLCCFALKLDFAKLLR